MSENRFMKSLGVLDNNETQPTAALPPTSTTGSSVPLLSEIVMKLPRKSRGVTHNIYLSKPVSQALEREAKRRDITKGKLVDEVLKRVLGVE